MKVLSAILLAVVGLTICGCNPDKSGDTQAPISAAQQTKPPTAADQNPNMPDAAKKQVSGSLPPAPKGN